MFYNVNCITNKRKTIIIISLPKKKKTIIIINYRRFETIDAYFVNFPKSNHKLV